MGIACLLLALFSSVLGAPQREACAKKVPTCEELKRDGPQETIEIRTPFIVGRLAGVVISPSGPVIPDAIVELIDRKERCKSVVLTDEDGKFDFGAVKPGYYGVRISKLGFNTVIVKRVKVSPRSKERLKLELPLSN